MLTSPPQAQHRGRGETRVAPGLRCYIESRLAICGRDTNHVTKDQSCQQLKDVCCEPKTNRAAVDYTRAIALSELNVELIIRASIGHRKAKARRGAKTITAYLKGNR